MRAVRRFRLASRVPYLCTGRGERILRTKSALLALPAQAASQARLPTSPPSLPP